MDNQSKTKDELIYESLILRKRVDELRAVELECKRIGDALRESEERYRTLAESAHDYIFTIDRDGNVVYANSFCSKEFKCDPEKLVGRNIQELFPSETSTRQLAAIHKVFDTGESIYSENKTLFPDREAWLDTWLVPLKGRHGQVNAVLGLSRDTTERKKSEESLRDKESFLSTVFVSIQDGISVLDKDMNIVRVNPVLEQWHPYKMPLVGKKCYEAYHGLKERCLICPTYDTLKTGKPAYEVIPRTGKDGETVGWLDLYSFPMVDPKTGELTGVIEYVRDITERKKAEDELNYRIQFEKLITTISTNFINLSADRIDEGIKYALEAVGQFVGVDRSYIFLLYDEGERMDNTHEWCVDGVDANINESQGLSLGSFPWFKEKLHGLEPIYIPHVANLPAEAEGEKKRFRSHGIRSLINIPMIYEGALVGFVGFDSVREEKVWTTDSISLLKIIGEIFVNALERKRADAQLRESEERFRNLVERASDSLFLHDMNGRIVDVNQMACDSLGYTREEFLGMKINDFDKGHSRAAVRKLWEQVGKKGPTTVYGKYARKDGTVFPVEVRVGLFDSHGTQYVLALARDITERTRTEREREKLNREVLKNNKRLKQFALKDPHTGLFNHRYLGEVIDAEFYRARRYGNALSVIMMDIDYFKSINDAYGHDFGDIVIKQFAEQLKSMVRRYDIVIRYGGEEFIIISPGINRHKAIVLAQRLLDAINLYNFGNKKHKVKLKLSAAVVATPEDHAGRGMDLITLAEKALNRAKEEGGNRVFSSIDIKKKAGGPDKMIDNIGDVRFLKERITKLTKRGNESVIEAIFAFAKTIEVKDHYTGEHAEKTVHYATEIAHALGLPSEEVDCIKQAAALHDLGKVGIPEKILLKPSKLSQKEFEEIKKHPQIGVDIIRPIQFMHDIIPLVLYHHERWDGKGYPSGLKGDEIPVGARIISLADTYHALNSDRPYRKAFPKREAIAVLKEGAGTQFDPKLVTTFLKILKRD